MAVIVYADFGSPECYLAGRRVDALSIAGVAVDWRAVERYPRVPVTGRPLGPDGQAEIERRMAGLADLLLPGETLPWTAPRLVPRTEAAVSGYAEAYGCGVGDDVRRLLYSAYWVDGADIGSPEVLRRRLAGPIRRGSSTSSPLHESGYAVAVSRGPVTTDAWLRIRAWRNQWETLGTAAVPTLVDGDAPPVTGEAVLHRLRESMLRSGAEPDPRLPDPARYPAVSVRPPMAWLSEVGGPWAHAWKGGA